MSDESVDPNDTISEPDGEYEPPAVFDFGSVFVATRGNMSGNSDNNGQGRW